MVNNNNMAKKQRGGDLTKYRISELKKAEKIITEKFPPFRVYYGTEWMHYVTLSGFIDDDQEQWYLITLRKSERPKSALIEFSQSCDDIAVEQIIEALKNAGIKTPVHYFEVTKTYKRKVVHLNQ